MDARTVRQHDQQLFNKVWDLAKGLNDSDKLELVSIIIDSVRKQVRPTAADDEEYSLRPFTMEELNARIDQAEAEIAAGNAIDDEDVWRELEEEFAREDAEEDARLVSSYVEKEQIAAV